jgi:hypothetical protein
MSGAEKWLRPAEEVHQESSLGENQEAQRIKVELEQQPSLSEIKHKIRNFGQNEEQK